MCTVVESSTPGLAVGERFYGLLPISSTFVVTPKMDETGGFVDLAACRLKGNVIYRTYLNTKTDLLYPGEGLENAMILLRPLFLTAWLLREAIHVLGCSQVVITSASR